MKDIHQSLAEWRELTLAYLALKYGLLESASKGGQTMDQLVQVSGLPKHRLVRLVRGLCWRKILSARDDESIHLTELGADYLEQRDLLLFQGAFFFRQWCHFEEYFEKGDNPYVSGRGEGIMEAIERDPFLGNLFASPWANRTAEYSKALALNPVFKKAKSVIDLGGAEGQLLNDILVEHPQMEGVVFDLPYCRKSFDAQNHSEIERLSFQEGSFFDAVPAGADVYMLKWILHDWDDAPAVDILSKCRDAMHAESVLLVIERIVPDAFAESIQFAQPDLNMLALNCGKERTFSEYGELLSQSGLKRVGCFEFPNQYGFSAIEAKLA